MRDKTKLKFAIAGYGYIGRRHASIISSHPGSELSALIDPDPVALADVNPGIAAFRSLDDFLDSDKEADVIVIATPNGTHASLGKKALEAKKHVLIEKPMALKGSDAEDLIRLANKMERKAMVVLQNRFSPVSVWLKQLVESHQLGKLFFAEVRCFWNRDERYYQPGSWHGNPEMDGGALFTQFSHFIDTIYWLFGDIKNINSLFNNFRHPYLKNFDDTGSVHFEFLNGGIGSVHFTTAAWQQNFESSITILAEHGSLKIGGQYMDKVEYCHINGVEPPALPCENDRATANHRSMIDAVIRVIKQDETTNAEEASHSVDIIERMYASGTGSGRLLN